jgi:hypothetical protein
MMRHVSVFRVKPECRTPEILDRLENELKALPRKVPSIIACEIGRKPMGMPTESPDGHVKFYDLIQMITFASIENCMGYPGTAGHQEFLATSSPWMEEVVGIDYPVDD